MTSRTISAMALSIMLLLDALIWSGWVTGFLYLVAAVAGALWVTVIVDQREATE